VETVNHLIIKQPRLDARAS